MTVQRLNEQLAPAVISLLDQLQVEVLGIQSRKLHRALVTDGVRGAIDCRVAIEGGRLLGVVLAAPARYWWMLPARHWNVALEVVRARWRRRARREAAAPPPADGHAADPTSPGLQSTVPQRTWHSPGDAWRIIFVGTAPSARGRGVAAALYRTVMAERALVARIALDNVASLRLHAAAGWQLYRDGDVALAVHVGPEGRGR